MTSFCKASLSGKWDKIRAELAHAFSTKSEAEGFTIEDLALLERVADAVVKRGMTAPATVFLESLGPMNFLGSQALYFLTPIVEWAFHAKEVEQVARLLTMMYLNSIHSLDLKICSGSLKYLTAVLNDF